MIELDSQADDSSPATLGDVRNAVDELAQVTNRSMGHLEQRLDRIELAVSDIKETALNKEDMAGFATKTDVAGVLKIVQSIDDRLASAGSIGARLDRLEDAVFRR